MYIYKRKILSNTTLTLLERAICLLVQTVCIVNVV